MAGIRIEGMNKYPYYGRGVSYRKSTFIDQSEVDENRGQTHPPQ
jgi:hypothetical protein